MVSQDVLLTMIRQHPGHTLKQYATMIANGNSVKVKFYTRDLYETVCYLSRWKLVHAEWDIEEDGVALHYYPATIINQADNLEYKKGDYSSALYEDRLSRGWTKAEAEYQFPSSSKPEIRYMARFEKAILRYVRKSGYVNFNQIGEELRSKHKKLSYLPRCIFNAHLGQVLVDLQDDLKLQTLNNMFYIHDEVSQ